MHALIPAKFSRTGLWAPNAPITPIRRFCVVGERSSGTNFVKRLLGRNSSLEGTEYLGWKHGFCQVDAIPADMAVICVVRGAADWALSMHAKPWHTSPETQALEFPDFIKAPWQTSIDRARYFETSEERGVVGQPLQHDRHPLTGAPFQNLFDLRQVKLAGLLSYFQRDCTALLVRMEAAQDRPEKMVDALLAALGQPKRTQEYRRVTRRLGSRFKPSVKNRPDTPDQMSASDLKFMRAHLDLKREAALGYDYDAAP